MNENYRKYYLKLKNFFNLKKKIDNSSLDPSCVGQRYWYAFFISSLITFFGGLFIIIFWRLISYFVFSKIGRKFKESVKITSKFLFIKSSQFRLNFIF